MADLQPPFIEGDTCADMRDIHLLEAMYGETIESLIDNLMDADTQSPLAPTILQDSRATGILGGICNSSMMSASARNIFQDVQAVITRVVSYTYDLSGSCPPELAPYPGYDGPLYIAEMTNNVMVALHGWRAQVEHAYRCVMAQRLVDLHIADGKVRRKTNLLVVWQTILPVLQSLITDKGIDTWIRFARVATLRMETHGAELREIIRSYDLGLDQTKACQGEGVRGRETEFEGGGGGGGGGGGEEEEEDEDDTIDISTFLADEALEIDEGAPSVTARPSTPDELDEEISDNLDEESTTDPDNLDEENINPNSSPETIPITRNSSNNSPYNFRPFDYVELQYDFRPFDFSELSST